MATTSGESAAGEPEAAGSRSLAILLAMAMFVLVVDTSLMNVSISAVVEDLDTTVSGVQSAIALEALVSAAFILISSKVGDLIGRKRAYVLGLLGYAVGALAMALAQGLTAIIIFWAIIGGLGASLLLPAMQSLIHGNFEGAAQKQAYALVGASAAIAAAVGPLLGGFLTTFLSWRVGFLLEVVVIAVVLAGIRLVKDVPYTGPRRRLRRRGALGPGHGRRRPRHPRLAGGRRAVGLLIAVGAVAMGSLAWLARPAQARGQAHAARSRPVQVDLTSASGSRGRLLQQIALGGAMIALPIFLQMVLEYNALQTGLSLAPLSLSMFGIAMLAGKRAGRRPARPRIIRAGFAAAAPSAWLHPAPDRAARGLRLVARHPADRSRAPGLGLLVSQLNNYTLAPIAEERVSEAAGVNSAAGSFGLSFGLALRRRRSCWRRSRLHLHDMAEAAPCSRRPSRSRSPTRSRTTPR